MLRCICQNHTPEKSMKYLQSMILGLALTLTYSATALADTWILAGNDGESTKIELKSYEDTPIDGAPRQFIHMIRIYSFDPSSQSYQLMDAELVTSIMELIVGREYSTKSYRLRDSVNFNDSRLITLQSGIIVKIRKSS